MQQQQPQQQLGQGPAVYYPLEYIGQTPPLTLAAPMPQSRLLTIDPANVTSKPEMLTIEVPNLYPERSPVLNRVRIFFNFF